MDAMQENWLVLLALAATAAVFSVVFGVLSSRTLREDGIRRAMKRWLG